MKKIEVLASLVIISSALVVGVVSLGNRSTVTVRAEVGGEYLACGCGCCDEGMKAQVRCVANQTELGQQMTADRNLKVKPNCKSVDCVQGVKYRICN